MGEEDKKKEGSEDTKDEKAEDGKDTDGKNEDEVMQYFSFPSGYLS